MAGSPGSGPTPSGNNAVIKLSYGDVKGMVLEEDTVAGISVPLALADRDKLPVRPVLGNHDAVAVVDQAAIRRHRLDAEPVALRQLAEALEVDDLELHEPGHEDAGQKQHDDARRDDARQEQALLLPIVLEL